MSENVVGIDPSLTSTGIVTLDRSGGIVSTERVRSESCELTLRARMTRAGKIVQSIMNFVNAASPKVVCVEAYAIGSNMPGTADRIEVGGLLRYQLIRQNYVVWEVGQSTLKKWATGCGKFPKGSGKTPMIVAITRRYQISLSTDDEIDAYALARVAYQIAGHEEPETVQQREAIATIVKPKVRKAPKRRKAES